MMAGATLIAGYAMAVVLLGDRMYPPELAESFRARPWGIYPHAFFGGVALLLGAWQFHRGILRRHRGRHRLLGKIYLVSALATGAAGLYMAPYSFGGAVTHVGFGVLGVLTVATTLAAFVLIRQGDVVRHREWMIRSYASLFAAVTLRLELPILMVLFGGPVVGFRPAYQVIAWLCWVPNIIVAELLIRSRRGTPHEREVLELAKLRPTAR